MAVLIVTLPEIEQSAGDDVALDFGGAAVDGGRSRVQVLRAPPAVVQFDQARKQVTRGVVEQLFGAGQQHLVDGSVRAKPVPVGKPVLGAAGPAAQGVQRQVHRAQLVVDRRALALHLGDQRIEARVQVGDALPEAGRTFERQQVHGQLPAVARAAEHPVPSTTTSSK